MLHLHQKYHANSPIIELWIADDLTEEGHFVASFLDEEVCDWFTAQLLDTYQKREKLWRVVRKEGPEEKLLKIDIGVEPPRGKES